MVNRCKDRVVVRPDTIQTCFKDSNGQDMKEAHKAVRTQLHTTPSIGTLPASETDPAQQHVALNIVRWSSLEGRAYEAPSSIDQ